LTEQWEAFHRNQSYERDESQWDTQVKRVIDRVWLRLAELMTGIRAAISRLIKVAGDSFQSDT